MLSHQIILAFCQAHWVYRECMCVWERERQIERHCTLQNFKNRASVKASQGRTTCCRIRLFWPFARHIGYIFRGTVLFLRDYFDGFCWRERRRGKDSVFMWYCMCVCVVVCVCVCVREGQGRVRERENVYVRERENECVCVCVCVCVWERESERERENVCVCERERQIERERGGDTHRETRTHTHTQSMRESDSTYGERSVHVQTGLLTLSFHRCRYISWSASAPTSPTSVTTASPHSTLTRRKSFATPNTPCWTPTCSRPTSQWADSTAARQPISGPHSHHRGGPSHAISRAATRGWGFGS